MHSRGVYMGGGTESVIHKYAIIGERGAKWHFSQYIGVTSCGRTVLADHINRVV